jgi:hypothetical protein
LWGSEPRRADADRAATLGKGAASTDKHSAALGKILEAAKTAGFGVVKYICTLFYAQREDFEMDMNKWQNLVDNDPAFKTASQNMVRKVAELSRAAAPFLTDSERHQCRFQAMLQMTEHQCPGLIETFLAAYRDYEAVMARISRECQ